MKTLTLILIIIFIFFLNTSTGFAAGCSSLAGTKGPHTFSDGSSGRLTGRDCNVVRNQDGSGVGPGNFSDVYTCVGSTGCIIQVSFCAVYGPDTADEKDCEESWTETSCEKAPPDCNKPGSPTETDISKIFGRILPPTAIQNFDFGAAGISKFLSNLVALIYSLAAVVLIFMLLWGAFDWLTSGGEKEKVEAARNRITYALIGMILFAVAFAIIQLLGTFTGFTFFAGQK